jgi:hypothetical protein
METLIITGLELWAVNGDPNNHGAGNLNAVFGELNIYIEDILIIVAVGDKAAPIRKFYRCIRIRLRKK